MTITQIIGLVVVLVLAALGGFFIVRKSESIAYLNGLHYLFLYLLL